MKSSHWKYIILYYVNRNRDSRLMRSYWQPLEWIAVIGTTLSSRKIERRLFRNFCCKLNQLKILLFIISNIIYDDKTFLTRFEFQNKKILFLPLYDFSAARICTVLPGRGRLLTHSDFARTSLIWPKIFNFLFGKIYFDRNLNDLHLSSFGWLSYAEAD